MNAPAPDPNLAATATATQTAPLRAKWTGVLFVHGMGSQRRFGDVSGLVEALDQRAREQARDREKVTPTPPKLPDDRFFSDIHPELEPASKADAPPIAYIETKWCPEGRPPGDWPTYRFYEAYWAPVTAGGVPTSEVVAWLFAQVAKPLGGFVTPWRGKARLRRSILQRMSMVSDDQRGALFTAYDEYEDLETQRKHPQPHFSDFVKFLRSGGQDNLVDVAKRWHRACARAEFSALAILVTIALALCVVTGLLLLTAVGIATSLQGATFNDRTPLGLARYLQENWTIYTMVGGMGLLVTGLTGGLRDYLGDVVFWTTYEETQTRYEKRGQILAEVRTYVDHITRQADCDRVVVVSHSLGTAVAVDAILAEARDARALLTAERQTARDRLRKIKHVVTYGSPIDKIHYFFERDPAQHRYHRVVEDLRGDIGTEPFGDGNGNPLVHWVNFWDRADVISGTLESPNSRKYPLLSVRNVEVSRRGLLNPVRAHTGYLTQAAVLDPLSEIILNGSLPATTAKSGTPSPPDAVRGFHRVASALARPAATVVRVGGFVLAAALAAAPTAFLIDLGGTNRVAPAAWITIGVLAVAALVGLAMNQSADKPGRGATAQLAILFTVIWSLVGVLTYCIATVTVEVATGITIGLVAVVIAGAIWSAIHSLWTWVTLALESTRALLHL